MVPNLHQKKRSPYRHQELMSSALECAPRGERDEWVLTITVGTQPLGPKNFN